ncbi:hypothetical protein DL771_001861 [Monosporascus sp. 5C6A]|nr:hypothetical protein DL771_001861 [Monosporascus sp. 5C6A]
MYTGDYSEDTHQELGTPDDDELFKDVRVYVLADMFLMDHLKEDALRKFKSKLSELWISEKFTDCVKEIYSSTNEFDCGLRNAAVETTKVHLTRLWEKKPFKELIREGGDFVVDLTGVLAER